MAEPILDPDYWRRRLEQAQAAEQLHLAVFRCPLDRWRRIEAKHREILARLIGPTDSVLDAGCGYGRLLDLMPPEWRGGYLGVDLSPDLIELARSRPPEMGRGDREPILRPFLVADLRDLSGIHGRYDWAVLISVRPMVRRNCGDDVWQQMESELRRVAKRLLYLEYDESEDGSVE